MIKKILKFIKEQKVKLEYISQLGFLNIVDDESYLKKEYFLNFGKKLGLENPKTVNKKLQWLKLHDRKDIYTIMVDRAEVKKCVASIIGKEYIIPTIGVYNKIDDINIRTVKKKTNKYLKRKYYDAHCEWSCKNIKPRKIVEKYMEDKKTNSLRDYNFFCFNGKPEILYISDNPHSKNQRIAFFDK